MQNRINNESFRQFILNENSPPDPGQTAEAVKRSLFSSVFYHTVYAFKELALKSLVLVMTCLSLIELVHDYFYSTREKNRNANFWFKHFLGTILFAAEAIAIAFFVAGTIVSALIAPAMFTAITGVKFLLSLTRTIYYAYQCIADYWNSETYTRQYAHHLQHFQEQLKNSIISAALFAGVFVAFLAPEVPAIVIPSMVALSVKWTAFATLGMASLVTLGQKISHVFKRNHHQVTEIQPINEPLIQPTSDNFLLNKLHLSNIIKNKYLINEKLDHLISSDIDDLLIKLEILHERKLDTLNFVSQLMTQEKYRINLESHKGKALHLLSKLLNGENLALRYNNASYDNSAAGIARYFEDQGLLKNVLHSSFETVGGMQKIFVLVDHYCQLNPDTLYQAPIPMEEKSNNAPTTRELQMIIRDLKADAKNNAHTIMLKEKENASLKRKFSKIGEMIFAKQTPNHLGSLKNHTLPRSNSLPKIS